MFKNPMGAGQKNQEKISKHNFEKSLLIYGNMQKLSAGGPA